MREGEGKEKGGGGGAGAGSTRGGDGSLSTRVRGRLRDTLEASERERENGGRASFAAPSPRAWVVNAALEQLAGGLRLADRVRLWPRRLAPPDSSKAEHASPRR